MFSLRMRSAALAICAGLGVTACTGYDDGYGYGGMSVGVGSGYYDPGYYAGDYGGYYGWYDDFYYPGNGYYVYDRGGKRHRWNDRQREYWRNRHANRNNANGNDGEAIKRVFNGEPPPQYREGRRERRALRQSQGEVGQGARGQRQQRANPPPRQQPRANPAPPPQQPRGGGGEAIKRVFNGNERPD